ncbi:MAG: RsmF rRNA methyltransferase first C-terminal domain-containing protein [Butyrivibrio sp.]|nr:RsmF rRNA methyltransferase first C-terminal domain-containing protein [Butyrivibrio sp.]
MLPEEFKSRMRLMLGSDYDKFEKSFESDKYQAIRLNTLKKGNNKKCLDLFSKDKKQVPWDTNGYYYEEGFFPGKHPYHEAGVYYIQEPSAMAPVSYLGVQPGEKVLDLCAAPGGKSTQIAQAMKGEGILVSNEINPARAKILSLNMERLGVRNALVLNEDSTKLSNIFIEYFDRILVDAPCSGEGMFRKNEDAISEWSLENVKNCVERQTEILDNASLMLRPGGRLVYSTCTFAPGENEGSITSFLNRHKDFHIVDAFKYDGMEPGCFDYLKADMSVKDIYDSYENIYGIDKTIRLWPHKIKGEGHYLAVLEKDSLYDTGSAKAIINGSNKLLSKSDLKAYREFEEEFLNIKFDGDFILFGEQLYLIPENMPGLRGLKVLRPGLHLGTIKKDRFEPSHALALFLSAEMVKNVHEISSEDSEIRSYLNGQTIRCEGNKGWTLITTDGFSIGWGKLAGTVLKNHYPKGLRINYQ